MHLLIDSTGVKIYGEGEWKTRQHGYSKRRTWRKIHLAIDRDSQQIVAAEVTTNDVGDGEVLEDLLDQIEEPIECVIADGAYDTKRCYEAIVQKKASAVMIRLRRGPPRRGAVITQHGNRKAGVLPRGESIREVRKKGRKRWKQEWGYHQ